MPVYEHLELVREEPTPERRKHGFGHSHPPANPGEHARDLKTDLDEGKSWQEEPDNQLGGFDDRLIFEFETDGTVDPGAYEAIAGVGFVSESEDGVVIVFADETGLSVFEERLDELARGEEPTRKDLLYALQSAGNVEPEDRKGSALRVDGFPDDEPFLLDVELWPVARFQQIAEEFSDWLEANEIEQVDRVRNRPQLVLFRIRATREQARAVLKNRDVRLVDLPGRVGIERGVTSVDIMDLPEIEPPPQDAPRVAVLDSGVVQNHPLLEPAIGDAESFLSSDDDPSDETGHGTLVSGIAVWGEVEELIGLNEAQPELRLLSGRVLDENNEFDERLIENQVREAVEYFHDEYGCRVFNLSVGNADRVYDGDHLRGLAVTLDDLARDKDVLFVVPTGNFPVREPEPDNWREEYPEHFYWDETRLLDPAPAMHALTVGSLAKNERTYHEQRYEPEIEAVPVARTGEPSPFSRTQGSAGGALKPELMAHGGNWAVNRRNETTNQGLGRLSTNFEFQRRGRLLGTREGTSFAAPEVAHLAGRLFGEFPDASQNLIRAMLVANASLPEPSRELLANGEMHESENRERLLDVCGYGEVDQNALFRSTDEDVVMYYESALENDGNHLFEIPIPDDFYDGGRRARRITVSLAHTSATRTTRLDYCKTRMEFRLIEAESVDEAAAANDTETPDEEYESISEFGSSKSLTHRISDREHGTVQASTWTIKQKHRYRLERKMFVVVTRKDRPWVTDSATEEPYALVVRVQNRGGEPIYQKLRANLQAKQRVKQQA